MGETCREPIVLLDQQNWSSFRLNPLKDIRQMIDDDRGQSFARLIQYEKIGPGQECATDRQHLLLATGKLAAEAAPALC